MKSDRRSQKFRDQYPNAAKVFDKVLNDYGRKQRPWMPFYGFDKSGIVFNLSGEEKDAYRILMLRFRHHEFDKLCRRISKKDSMTFDAWGPFHLPTYKTFYSTLTKKEHTEFSGYLTFRRAYTIDIETQYLRDSTTYEIIEDLIQQAAGNERAQFRYVASIIEYGDNEVLKNFSQPQYDELVKFYETKKKRFEEIIGLQVLTQYLAPSPLKWNGTKTDLVAIIDSLKKANLLTAQDSEIIHHFDFAAKYGSRTPYKRFSGTRTELKNGESYVDQACLTRLIEELQKYQT